MQPARLSAHHITKSYNIQPVLQDVTFSLNPGERLGLIGPNGSGKTTLLRILVGQEQPDQGAVTFSPPDLRLGYLQQGFEPAPGQTIAALVEQALGDPAAAAAEVERLASALASRPDDPQLHANFDAALTRLEALPQRQAGHARSILAALGLGDLSAERLASALSGGQKTRLALALVLLGDPQVLLLDEPTNHLDIAMLEWLEDWLQSYPGAALVVSHDRLFLDHTVNRILDLDPESHSLREYAGNYSAYLEQYQAERSRQDAAYRDQVYEVRRMQQDINRLKQQSKWVEMTTTPRSPGVRRIAKKVARKALSREKKLERYLESDERVEKVRDSWQMKADVFSQGELARSGQDVLVAEGLAVGYPGGPRLLENIELHLRLGQRIVLTGANGCGKTTLLRTIAGALAPLAGRLRLGTNVRLGYMTQEQENLPAGLSALQVIQSAAALDETAARAFLHFFLFSGDDPLRPLESLSYGERARLSLAQLVAQGCNFLLLDEPINHLDIPSRARFEQALAQFEGTILAVVHDRYFIERFAEEVWSVENGQLVMDW